MDLSFGFKIPTYSWSKEILDRLWLIATKLPTRKALYIIENTASQYIEMGEIDEGISRIIKFKEFVHKTYRKIIISLWRIYLKKPQ